MLFFDNRSPNWNKSSRRCLSDWHWNSWGMRDKRNSIFIVWIIFLVKISTCWSVHKHNFIILLESFCRSLRIWLIFCIELYFKRSYILWGLLMTFMLRRSLFWPFSDLLWSFWGLYWLSFSFSFPASSSSASTSESAIWEIVSSSYRFKSQF